MNCYRFIQIVLGLCFVVINTRAQVFVSPRNYVTAEGSGGLNSAPFNNVCRYQQIYAASEFAPLTGPRLITQIAFRADTTQPSAFTRTFTNIQVNLSTTTRAINALNSTFASNVGSNDTVVFSGSLSFTTANTIAFGTAKQFDMVINLTTPFLYDPNAGNLLLDIRNFSSGSVAYFDGASDSSGSRVRLNFLDGSTSGATGTVQAFGICTRFTFQKIMPTGPVVPELAALDQAMTNYLVGHAFKAGTLALMKNSKLVFRQGYGWRDTNLVTSTHPDNLFRLASISKPITGCVIRKLLNAGSITTGTKVYSYLGIAPWGGTLSDNRITNVTVQHLLDHKGGWNRDVSPVGDPVFRTIQIADEMGLGYPAAASNVISWMFSKALDFTPGTESHYSNFGYGILGRVAEKASGKSYMNYLQQNLLAPVGLTNIIQSRSRPRDLNPWEIWYDDSSLVRSAVDYPTNMLVRWVDGGGYLESYDAFGGISASAPALCRFMLKYWLAGDQRVPGSGYGWNYLFYGSLPGTTTAIYQTISQNSTSTNGTEYAALFNARTDNGDDNGEANTAINNAMATITSWPTNGGGSIQWNVSCTNVSKNAGSVTVQLTRSGLSTLPVKVSYMTYSYTADTNDYAPASGIVSFAAGETNKTVAISILNDGHINPTQQFLLELISASGGAWLGDRVTCTVSILDDSTPPRFWGQPVMKPDGYYMPLMGATGLVVRVDYSTNLLTATNSSSWQLLRTYSNFPGALTIVDSNAVYRARSFYRAVALP